MSPLLPQWPDKYRAASGGRETLERTDEADHQHVPTDHRVGVGAITTGHRLTMLELIAYRDGITVAEVVRRMRCRRVSPPRPE